MSKRKHCDDEMDDKREHKNQFPDYGAGPDIINSDGQLCGELATKIQAFVPAMLVRMEEGLKYNSDERDYSIYTGTTGIALLYLHLYKIFDSSEYLKRAKSYVKLGLRQMRGRRQTFLCGDAGPLAVGAVVYNILGNESYSQELLSKLKDMHVEVLSPEFGLPDEILYGKAGYLYSLLFVQKRLGKAIITDELVQKVCNTIFASGKSLAREEKSKSPLMYMWHEKHYIGAAHGISGILYLLMQVDLAGVKSYYDSLIKPSVDFIDDLKFPSGNYPSSLSNKSDRLVQWCHGAPGVIYMLLQAYKIFGEQKYLDHAKACGDVIWERGLLKKGYGICHGTAGNGYGFLALYQVTKDPKDLYRASKFAEWCTAYGKHECRTPDRPYSLFEGMAGAVYFLADILTPGAAKFPAFEL
ncbi:lanC-like protein 2 [Ptychodera flava]|uniref:lanC-like protein 2 n=1 Tax=Ptychodera flava TaxID=63121 RepID=UPI003969F345